ncbi:polysaccharide deacetylase family protein [Luteolibacter algae]|uniref:Polysaccharide deacetylase family protein n=1 Tax=Luteolibacter algae TaxID=454151 RepID=A0ABW5D4U2_9BACT
MKRLQAITLIWAALWLGLGAQTEDTPDVLPAAQPIKNLDVPDDGVRVSVLGYHDFSETERETAMRIRTSKFRKQMEVIRQLGLSVIPMSDFIAWKNGEKSIPAKSVVITLDDGWKSVYTEAYPVLKEFGYPFTIYLYKNYVDGGGKALTTAMIKEMMANGANIGSHSTTHPFPQTVKNNRKRGAESYDKFLDVEMGESRRFLEEKFGVKVTTFAYPGGYFTEEMLSKAEQVGYTQLFTVQPGKVKRSLPNNILPRYIILGNYDKIFEFATSFRDSQSALPEGSIAGMIKELEYPVEPQPGAIINSRLPEIKVDFSKAENIDMATLRMQVAGFGEVPANYASEGKIFSWQVNRRLRQPVCNVLVSWKDLSGKETETPLRWSFQIDRGAAYLPDE